MLGCEGMKVYQFFYQSKEEFEKMKSHSPNLFIIPPIYDVNSNLTIYQYDFGKQIPLQLIIDVFEQSKYFRLRVGQLMRIIEIFIQNLLQQREKGMLNHDLDPKNIWIAFSQGSLGPTFNDQIDFNVQIQGRWKKQEIENYNDKIYDIVYQITKIMDKSIPKKEIKEKESLQIQKLKKDIKHLFPMVSLQQLLDEIKNLQQQYLIQGFKLKQKTFMNKRNNRVKNAQQDIQGIFKDSIKIETLDQSPDQKQTQQSQFFLIISHLIDFTQHFSLQLKNTLYSNFKKSKQQEFIDINTFNTIQDKITEYHPFKIGQLDRIKQELILQAFALRGYLNYPNHQIDPSVKISTLIKDFILFSLSETQKIHMHFIEYYKIDKDLSDIKENCRIQIGIEIVELLNHNDIEKFQNNQGDASIILRKNIQIIFEQSFINYQSTFLNMINQYYK
ncbi:hypothetical protein pb186bvf_007279 [Paramecium bursaria]